MAAGHHFEFGTGMGDGGTVGDWKRMKTGQGGNVQWAGTQRGMG